MSIRVLLADDHQIVRDGLKSMLANELDIQVVGEAENGRQALDIAREIKPDVVVMDIGMHDLNGIDATRRFTDEQPNVHVVALSTHSDRRFVSAMLAAGATGYLLKHGAFEDLATAIRMAAEGHTFLSAAVAGTVVEDYVRHLSAPAETPLPGPTLSSREREVLQLMAEGLSTREIAETLHLSVKTIETHRRQIMEKLGIYNVAGLIKFAVREGISSLED